MSFTLERLSNVISRLTMCTCNIHEHCILTLTHFKVKNSPMLALRRVQQQLILFSFAVICLVFSAKIFKTTNYGVRDINQKIFTLRLRFAFRKKPFSLKRRVFTNEFDMRARISPLLSPSLSLLPFFVWVTLTDTLCDLRPTRTRTD